MPPARPALLNLRSGRLDDRCTSRSHLTGVVHESDLRTDATTDEVVATVAEWAALFLSLSFFATLGMIELRIWVTTSYTTKERSLLRKTDYFLRLIVLCFMGIVPNLEAEVNWGTLIAGEEVARLAAQKTTLKCNPVQGTACRERSLGSMSGHSPSRPAFIPSDIPVL